MSYPSIIIFPIPLQNLSASVTVSNIIAFFLFLWALGICAGCSLDISYLPSDMSMLAASTFSDFAQISSQQILLLSCSITPFPTFLVHLGFHSKGLDTSLIFYIIDHLSPTIV